LLFLPLLPVLLVSSFPQDQIVHDRYLYLPLLGFLMVVFSNAERFVEGRFGTEKAVRFVFAAAIVVSVPLGVVSMRYNRVWANDLSLWERTVNVDPANVSGLVNYGVALSDAGRIDEAIEAFNRSIDVRPTSYAYLGRAQNFIRTDRFEEAVWDLQTVTEMRNEDVNAYTLFQSYEALGVALERKSDFARAERFLREARRRLPIYGAALTEKIAIILYRQNRKREALLELEAAQAQARVELLPSSKAVFLRIGMLRAEFGDREGAREALAEYLRLTTALHDRNTLADRAQALELIKKL
jgi:tetratricopeptide (TPR) repeat protein